MLLIDTDVLIEVLRGSASAAAWLESLQSDSFGIPGVAAMELIRGCRNQTELRQVRKFLSSFRVLWPEAQEFAFSYDLLVSLSLSSAIGIPDCLIAAMALNRKMRLYTFNVKHFQAVPGLNPVQPYSRA